MSNLIQKAFEVFGNELPDRDLFQATEKNPVTMLMVKKEFKTYEEFKKAYLAFVINKRTKAAKDKVVTTEMSSKGAKHVKK